MFFTFVHIPNESLKWIIADEDCRRESCSIVAQSRCDREEIANEASHEWESREIGEGTGGCQGYTEN